jgi:hypothetical protein
VILKFQSDSPAWLRLRLRSVEGELVHVLTELS